VYHGNNVRHPLYPRTAGQTQTLTYVMSSCSTNLKPKCQLTINLDPGWECPSLLSKENKKRKKKKKVPNQKSEEKQKKENSRSRIGRKTEEICRKVFGPGNIWTIQSCHQVNKKKKGNHDLKWSSPFNCQPKSCVSVTCSPHTKQKQKRKRPRTLKTKFPTRNKPFPGKSPIDPRSRM